MENGTSSGRNRGNSGQDPYIERAKEKKEEETNKSRLLRKEKGPTGRQTKRQEQTRLAAEGNSEHQIGRDK